MDHEGRLVAVSDAWLARLGYARHQVIGRSMRDVLTDGSARSFQAALPLLLTEQRVDDLALQVVCQDGRVIDVQLAAVNSDDPAGGPLLNLSVMTDVTERVDAERALRIERERMRNLVEGCRAGTFEWDLASDAFVVNERGAQIVGHHLSDLSGMTHEARIAMIHPDDVAQYRAAAAQHLAGKTDHYEVEIRLRHCDGHFVWVLCRGTALVFACDGRPERVYGTQEDITARKSQQDALRKSEEFLERASRLAGIGAWEIDLSAGTVTFAAQTRRMLGLEPDARLTIDETMDFYAPEVRQTVDQAFKLSRFGTGFDLEVPMVCADGRRIWARVIGQPVVADEMGLRQTGVFKDISERVAERERLRALNERLTLATDSGGIGIWDWDIQADRLTWDDWMFRIFGMDREDGSPGYARWLQFLHPDDLQAAEQAVRDAIEGSRHFDEEFRIVRGDGSIRHIRATGVVTRDATGKAVRMVGSNCDMTEHRRLGAELAEKHELLRVTLQSIGDGVITTDGSGRVVWLNPIAERLTGWPASEAIGQPVETVFDAVDGQSGAAVKVPVAACLASRAIELLPDRTVLRARDGRQYGVEDSVAPIRNDRGKVLGAVLVFHDVTAQRALRAEHDGRERALKAAKGDRERLAASLSAARDEAQRASLAKSRFLAGMSHELRTPLNGVLGYAQLLRAEGGLSTLQMARTDAMVAAGRHLLEMINSVLDLSEIEHERSSLRPIEIDVQALCRDCLDMVGAAAEAKRLELGLTVARGTTCAMSVDATRLRQILLNLLGNAVKFTPSGRVELGMRATDCGRALRFEVADTGPGIDPDKRARLFQDFDRLDIDTTSTVEGAGLGLAISARLARSMGGRLGYAAGIDGGSVFWLELSVNVAQPSSSPSASPIASARTLSAALRVLVVDDVAMNRDIARSFLQMSGHSVSCASDGAEAITLAMSGDFDVILMDVRMPGMDGLEATRRIRMLPGAAARVPIIGLTALAFTEQVAACREAGMTAHVAKPYGADALMAAIAAVIGDHPGEPALQPATPAKPRVHAVGQEWPVLDETVLARLGDYLPAETIQRYLQALDRSSRELLFELGSYSGAEASRALVTSVHRVAGSAGMLGYERLAKVGLRLEQAALAGAELAPLADALAAAIESSLADMQPLCAVAEGIWQSAAGL